MENNNTMINSVIGGIGAFFIAIVVALPIYFVLGLLTGVFGMCSFAPEWWLNIYLKLIFIMPFAAVIIGVLTGKHISNKQHLR